MKKRIEWIDGLKTISAFGVCLLHYLLIFYPKGYIGFKSGVPSGQESQVVLDNFFFSLLTNNSLVLYIFFALISFLPAYRYFSEKNISYIKHQAQNRYFRFVIPISTITFISCFFWHFDLNFNLEVGKLTNSNWVSGLHSDGFAFWEVLYTAFIKVYYSNADKYYSILWCIYIIFIGSYISYAIIFATKYIKQRYLLYVISGIVLFYYPIYLTFLAGIVLADMYVHLKLRPLAWLIPIGCIIGTIPDPLIPYNINRSFFYAISSFLIILGCCSSSKIQKSLSNSFFNTWGKISFSLILSHLIVMQSVSAGVFVWLASLGLSFCLDLFITTIITLPSLYLGTILFQKLTEKISQTIQLLLKRS